jgi:hypothetical protein
MSALQYGVPQPFPFEAPSSWLSRLAMAQGCRVEEAKAFVGFPSQMGRDLVDSSHSEDLAVLRQRCGLPTTAFAEATHLMDVALSVGRLFLANGWARFHYCPLCLSARPTAYLDIHWRLNDRRYCLVHGCLLEFRCPECGASLTGPPDMIYSRMGREGHASLRRCRRCCFNLASVPPRYAEPFRNMPFTQVELRLIEKRVLMPLHGRLPRVPSKCDHSQSDQLPVTPTWWRKEAPWPTGPNLPREQAMASTPNRGPAQGAEFQILAATHSHGSKD